MPSSAGITALVSTHGCCSPLSVDTGRRRGGWSCPGRFVRVFGVFVCGVTHELHFSKHFYWPINVETGLAGGEEEPLASKLASCHPPPQPRPPTIKYITTNNIRILFTLEVSFVDSRRDLIPWSYFHVKSSIMKILG